MQSLIPVLVSLLLSLGIVLGVDLVATYLRRRARRTTHASEQQVTERRADESTD